MTSTYLENLTSIPMECSDVEYDELYAGESEFLENQNDRHGSSDNSIIIESSNKERKMTLGLFLNGAVRIKYTYKYTK